MSDKIRLTKGQKNAINGNRWARFIKDVEHASYRRVVKVFSGPEPTYSFTPDGGGLGFDDRTSVALYLRNKYCPEIETPSEGSPYTQEEIDNL